MITSGIKDFYINAQQELSFSCNIAFDRVSGANNFSINGKSGDINFSFVNGRVIDHNDRFVWSYRSGESVLLSGDIYNSSLSYWINNVPIGVSRVNENYYTGASIQTSSGITANCALSFFGDIPSYNFLYSGSIISGQNLPVLLINNNENSNKFFSVISGGIEYTSGFNPYVVISGFENNFRNIISGGQSLSFSLVPTGNYVGQFQIPVTFYTDFGRVDNTFIFDYTSTPVYYKDFYLLMSGIEPYSTTGFYAEYDVYTSYPLFLDVSGTINEYVVESLLFSSGVSGLGTFVINGVTYSGVVTGTYYDTLYATGCLSGSGNYKDNTIFNPVESDFFGPIIGYYPSHMDQFASGYLTGIFSGYFDGGSGTVTGFSYGSLTGNLFYRFPGDIFPQQVTNIKNYSNKEVSGPLFLSGENGFVNYTGSLFYMGYISGGLTGKNILGSGDKLVPYNAQSFPCITGESGRYTNTGFKNVTISSNFNTWPSFVYIPGFYRNSFDDWGVSGETYSGITGFRTNSSWGFSVNRDPFSIINSGFYSKEFVGVFSAQTSGIVNTGAYFAAESEDNYYHVKYKLTLLNQGVDQNIFVMLSGLSGDDTVVTGNYTSQTQPLFGTAYGYIENSGRISGYLSGVGITRPNFYNEKINWDVISGQFLSPIIYATGCFSYYDIPYLITNVPGLPYNPGTGYLPSYCFQSASGLMFGAMTGTIEGSLGGGSGILSGYINGFVTGSELIVFSGSLNLLVPPKPLGDPLVIITETCQNIKYVDGIVYQRFQTTGIDPGYYEYTGEFLYQNLISGGLTGANIAAIGFLDSPYPLSGCFGAGSGSGNFPGGDLNYSLPGSLFNYGNVYYPSGYYCYPTGGTIPLELYSGNSNLGLSGAEYRAWVPPVSYINSGFYEAPISGRVTQIKSGIIFEDSFISTWSGNINTITGLNDDGIIFSIEISEVSGSYYKIFNFDFYKRVSVLGQNLLTGSAYYLISGNNDLLYSGIITYI